MKYFVFNLQRFAGSETISTGDSYSVDGVTYTATTDAVLNLDDDNKVSGLESGSVTAVVTGAKSSPEITFDASGGAINFTAVSDDDKIIKAIMVIPFEIISGEYTFNGSTLAISAGSKFVIVDQRGDYSLRNENTFVYDGTYTFSSTSMTSNCERVISVFTLSDGTNTRTLNLEQRGPVINNFTQQGFTLVKGSSEVMNIGNYTITATAVDKDAGLNISLGADGITLIPNSGDGALNVALSRGGQEIFAGDLECTSGSITFGYDHDVTFAAGTSFSFKWNDYVSTVTTTDKATTAIELTDDGKISFTPGKNDGGLNLVITKGGTPVFGGALNVTDGTITFDPSTQKFSFTEGTKIALAIGDGLQEIDFEVVDGDASFKIVADTSGNFTITPDNNDGSLDVTLKRGGETVFKNNLSVNGSMIINPTTDLLTLTDGTIVSVAFNNYTLTATADGNASSKISLTANGISIMPQTGDGTLNLTLSSADGSMSANIEVLSGGFLFGKNGALTVIKDTELKIDFGDGYIVNFKANDAAGGTISLGEDGITFAPGSNDGGLQLTITRDGQTRSASLDVTGGSVTYKLDGSISFADGTVVDLTWADGINLKLKSSGSSASIKFDLNKGIRINSTDENLDVILTTTDGYVTEINSIEGGLWYKAGTVTLDAGTVITGKNVVEGRNIGIRFEAVDGDASLNFSNEGITYSAGTGKNFITYTLGTAQSSFTVNKGSVFIQRRVFHVAEGSDISTDFKEFVAAENFTLDEAGNYTINGMKVTTTSDNVQVVLTDYDTIRFAEDADIKISATAGDKFFMVTHDGTEDTIQVTTKNLDNVEITNGTITLDNTTKTFSVTAGTTVTVTQDEEVITFTTPEEISAPYKVEENIYYFDIGNIKANVSLASGGQTVRSGELEFGGVISYNPDKDTFGLTGANSSHGDGTNSFAQFTNEDGYSIKIATHDTTVVFVPKISNGNIEINFPNDRKHELLFTISKDGSTTFEGQVTIGGTIGFKLESQEIFLRKGTVLTLVGDGENALEITALDDAGGQLTFKDNGIRFAPNAGDGQLELNFVATDRKANIDVSSGAIIFNSDRTLSLEKDTVVNLTWTDGVKLKMMASDTGGSIGFDSDGLKISSNGELSIDLTAGDLQTQLSNLNGTIHYNAGKVLFDADSKLTATSSLGGLPTNITLESNGTGGYLEFSANGTNYVAGTGPMQITWSRDDKSSTFAVANGSVYIGHGIFRIAEGTELSTDLKDLIPALYFTTSDAGTYTINGQTITTSGANLSMTATDDRMTFTPGDNIVGYDGMLFTGDGNVTLTKDGVILGAGIEATGFGETNTFILNEKGFVQADGKTFELTEDVPTGISVTGAQDGFIFSRTITAESEERLGITDSTDIGKVFTEEFVAKGDDTYRIQTDLLGLQQIIGITSPVTVNAAADVAGESAETIFDLVTDTTGTFTTGDKTYTISGDSSVVIKGIFNTTINPCARGFDDLNGTVSGDFTEHAVTINSGSAYIIVHGDKVIDIAVNDNGAEIFNVSSGATLETYSGVSKAHTDGAGKFVLGATADESLLIQTGDAATFEFDDQEYLTAINDISLELEGGLSYVSAYDDLLFVHGAQSATVNTADPEKVWTQLTGDTMTLNGNELTLTADDDGVWIRDKEFVGLDEGATLQVGEAGIYTSKTPYPDSKTVVTLNARAGDLIVGLADNDAYIYNANNPLITRNTPSEDIVELFKPKDYEIVTDNSDYNAFTLEGGDLLVVEDTSRAVIVTNEEDTDNTIVSQGKNVNVTMNGGNTWLFPTGGNMTLHGYDHSTGTGFGTTYTDIAAAIDRGVIDFGDGKITLGSAQVDMGANSELVNFFDRSGKLQKVGYAGKDDSISTSDLTGNMILVGENNSTLTGGSGKDTIFASKGNFIDAGKGSNLVKTDGEATILFNGRTTVENFHTGFGDGSDTIYIAGDPAGVTFKDGALTFSRADDKLTLSNVTTTAKVNVYHERRNVLNKGVFIAQDDWYEVEESDLIVDAGEELYFVGTSVTRNQGVDFSGVTKDLNITLNTEYEIPNNTMWVNNVHSIKGGAGLTTIIGSDKSDTILAGTGRSSVWGNRGNDLLIGNNSADKSGRTEFFFFAGDGRDIIRDFDFLTEDNTDIADKIELGNSNVTAVRVNNSGDVIMQVDGGDDYLTVEDAQGEKFRVGDFVATVAKKSLTYDTQANFYVATETNASLTVNGAAEVWLDGSHDKSFVGDFKVLDASKSDGNNILAGNDLDNTILGGQGDTSLWGGNSGSGGDDLLIGGAAKNTFFYGMGDGNDKVQAVNDGDNVILYDITLDQIADAKISADSVLIKLSDGGSLQVNGSADATYQLADGSKFSADHQQLQWQDR